MKNCCLSAATRRILSPKWRSQQRSEVETAIAAHYASRTPKEAAELLERGEFAPSQFSPEPDVAP